MKLLSLPCPAQVPAHDWRRAQEYTAALISRRLRLLPWWADPEQVEIEGWLALWRAGERWEPTHGATIVTYAGKVVWGALIEALRSQAPLGQRTYIKAAAAREAVPVPCSLDAELGDDGGSLAETLVDDGPGPEELALAADLREQAHRTVCALLGDMRPDVAEMLWHVYGLGLSVLETRRRLGLSAHQARTRLGHAQHALRRRGKAL